VKSVQVARLIGYAGSGKTTELLRVMEQAKGRLGGDPLRLGFASFTRAARAEAVARASSAWNVPEQLLSGEGWFRTIHSTCRRCLDVPASALLTDRKADLEWISEALGVKVSSSLDDETGVAKFIGDPAVASSLNAWQLARVTLMPVAEVGRRMRVVDDTMPSDQQIVSVCKRYEMAKRVEGRVDFTDLLSRFAGFVFDPSEGVIVGRPEGYLPDVAAWLFDEQQDASPLLDAVCRRLVSAPSVQWCYVVGDPFQAIYGFAGSTADCFLSWDADKERTMPKSWRCPRPIVELGERCLRRMHRGYFDRRVEPADHAGEICEAGGIEDAVSQVNPEDDWLLLARTNYQANRLFAAMASQGKPARWVKSGEVNKRQTGMLALHSLESGEPINGEQWAAAIELIPARRADGEAMLTRGTKARYKDANHRRSVDAVWLDEAEVLGVTPVLAEAIRSGGWEGLVDYGQEWRRKARRWGPRLTATPKVRIGTIHSAKGMEARNVGLLTTTSKRVEAGKADQNQHDEECRLAYVAVTRAKERLMVIHDGLPGANPAMEVL